MGTSKDPNFTLLIVFVDNLVILFYGAVLIREPFKFEIQIESCGTVGSPRCEKADRFQMENKLYNALGFIVPNFSCGVHTIFLRRLKAFF